MIDQELETTTIENSNEAAPVETAAPETTEGSEGAPEGAPVVEAYVPNRKFKVLDKELEIPELYTKVMTKETEKEIRELFEKAHGLDHVKPKYEATKTRLSQIEPHYEQIVGSAQNLVQMRDKNDIDGIMNFLGIKEEVLYKHIIQKHKQSQLPEEQRQVLEQNQASAKKLEAYEARMAQLEQQLQSHSLTATETQLQNLLQQEGVKQVAEAIDQKLSQPGAFMNEVVHYAAIIERQGGTISMEDAVKAMTTKYQSLMGLGQPASQPQDQVQQQTNKPKATLPNFGSGQNSTRVGRAIRSIADLEAEAKDYA